MYKRIIILLIILFCGCSNKSKKIETIIENNENHLIGINYPITNSSLDNKIKNDIDNIYHNFKNKNRNHIYLNDKSELNIDYKLNEFDNYISIIVYVYIDSYNENNEYTMTYFYDLKKQKILKIKDITNDIDIINDITNYDTLDKFFIEDNYLFIYGKKTYKIELNDLNMKIKLKEEKKIQTTSYVKQNKVIDPNDKFIALTFDDGPSIYTDELIEYLNKNNCNATFFVLGNKVKLYNDVLKKSLRYGNEIGNHSYNHKWLAKLSLEEYKEQINKTQNIIKKYTGYTPAVLRPTYGSVNDIIKKNSDLDIVLWNVDTLDWKYKNSNKITERATKNLKDGNIILMHDTHKTTLEAVKKIVPIIKNKGFKCITISDLKEVNILREKQHG